MLKSIRLEIHGHEHLLAADIVQELCDTLQGLLGPIDPDPRHRELPQGQHWRCEAPHTSHGGIYGVRYVRHEA
jgi:hypothetical protein